MMNWKARDSHDWHRRIDEYVCRRCYCWAESHETNVRRYSFGVWIDTDMTCDEVVVARILES